jgi:glycosyltransferase involved in cell wall biosynthesis
LKILLFTEIFDCGGVDTFIINLINKWPVKNDSFVIAGNANYPGLRIIEREVTRPCAIIRHNVLIFSNVLNGSFVQKVIRRILSPVLRYILICYNVLAFRKLLQQAKSDVLLVINGGYPAGDSCRAAAISWGMFSGRPKSVHNYHSIVQKAPWYLFFQESVVDWLLCKYTSKFVTVSKAAAASMFLRPQIFTKKIPVYIYNGYEKPSAIPAPDKRIRDEIGVLSTTPLCLMLGTYGLSKGHFFLFQAFKQVLQEVPNAHLLICGYGFPHELKQVRQYVQDFQLLDSVHLMDFRTDISHLLANTDVLVVASQAYESFGYTSVEAMAHYVPVVATNVGGIPEVVVNDEGGYCVDSRDVDSYARCIINLLKNEDLRKEQGKRGYARYCRLFTAERMSHQYAEMIHKLNG